MRLYITGCCSDTKDTTHIVAEIDHDLERYSKYYETKFKSDIKRGIDNLYIVYGVPKGYSTSLLSYFFMQCSIHSLFGDEE